MSTIITGKFIKNGEVATYGANGFRKKEIVVETTNEQYAQKIQIDLTQDNVNLTQGLKPNDVINVHVNIQGREWINPEGVAKYFNSLVGWKIEKVAVAAPVTNTAIQQQGAPIGNEPDDLPF